MKTFCRYRFNKRTGVLVVVALCVCTLWFTGWGAIWMHSPFRCFEDERYSKIDAAIYRAFYANVGENNRNCLARYGGGTVEIPPEDYQRLSKSRFFVVANLHDNEPILPYFLSELLLTLRSLRNLTSNNKDSIFVSIYESASKDLTPYALKVFSKLLDQEGINHLIITNKTDARGVVQPRIEFLKNMRNKAMEPLYNRPKDTFTHVIFLNDILFCQQDVFRLLVYGADMACGLDFDVGFRDTWVGRTIDGREMKKKPPFGTHNHSAAMVSKGRAFHVFSCWNGIVVINAKPFYDGVRFHDGTQTPCPTSECLLFAIDLWMRGYTKILIDPLVRVAYKLNNYVYVNSVGWIKGQIHSLKVNKDITWFDMPPEFTCCPAGIWKK